MNNKTEIKWIPSEIYRKRQELSKQKEIEMLNFMRTGFINEQDNKNYFELKKQIDKIWQLLEGSDFTNKKIQNLFSYELHKILSNEYKLEKNIHFDPFN